MQPKRLQQTCGSILEIVDKLLSVHIVDQGSGLRRKLEQFKLLLGPVYHERIKMTDFFKSEKVDV